MYRITFIVVKLLKMCNCIVVTGYFTFHDQILLFVSLLFVRTDSNMWNYKLSSKIKHKAVYAMEERKGSVVHYRR